ncbi:hypothetical protein [Nocardiopsis lambiniae]|uniref:Uncharacterized protein n=1 Tax=Nocardiopsis lambiniae TaxID=3075539 RepID=A0ABU2M454_9ACTN|nr:hypothetical protein [Nocardiopsis sp. DSM 44743]MDT0327382.1 hypothetical protein [Nocardiopsis sp. DSM 44743]
MRRVCDIREFPSIRTLGFWAHDHDVPLRYLGPTLEGRAVYAATHGCTTRVAVTSGRDPHPLPLVWRSPLEVL